MNRYIRTNNLNNLRQYSSVRLHNSNLNNNVNEIRINYSDNYLEIGRIIYNSLNNNTPVPLAFTGRFNSSENNRNHFILINGITIASNNISFRYMDPDEGTSGFFLLIN